MVKNFFALFLIAFVLTSCDDSPKRVFPKGKSMIISEKEFPKDREAPIEIPPPPAPYTGPQKFCFEMELGNNPQDITLMQFILEDNDSIRGHLDYSFTDHAPLHGTVEGLKEGKYLELNYSYNDSGQFKKEQLILKLDGDKLYKKTGPLTEENGILVLENPLTASLQLFLMKVDCK